MGNPYLPRFLRELEAHGVTVVRSRVPSLGASGLDPGDWVHFHWPGGPLISRRRWLYAWRLRRFERQLARLKRRRIRLAWTAHNLVPHDDPHPELGRRGRRALLGAVDHVFGHFPSAQQTLAEDFGYRGPFTVIPHGNYLDDYGEPLDRAESRARLGLPERGLVLLMLGWIRPYKGIGDAIHGFRLAAEPDDRLVIAGRTEGDVRAELAEATGDPRVIVKVGRVPDDEVAVYHAAADAMIAAHRATFTSGSAVMALSLGLPIVGPAVHHLASLGPEPRLFACEPGPEGLAAGIAARRAYCPVDPGAIREWTRVHLSWAEAGEKAAQVFLAPPA